MLAASAASFGRFLSLSYNLLVYSLLNHCYFAGNYESCFLIVRDDCELHVVGSDTVDSADVGADGADAADSADLGV